MNSTTWLTNQEKKLPGSPRSAASPQVSCVLSVPQLKDVTLECPKEKYKGCEAPRGKIWEHLSSPSLLAQRRDASWWPTASSQGVQWSRHWSPLWQQQQQNSEELHQWASSILFYFIYLKSLHHSFLRYIGQSESKWSCVILSNLLFSLFYS